MLIYRLHAFTVSQFLVEFEEVAPAVDLLPGRSVFLGDFNIHYDCPWKAEVKAFTTIITSLNYHQLIVGPTHIAGHTLDMLIVKESDHLLESQITLKLHVSDQFQMNCTLNIAKPLDVKTTYASRNFRSIDSNAFECDLSDGSNRILVDDINDVDSLVRRYNHVCKKVLHSHAPLTVRIHTKPSWFNNSVDKARRSRRRHERKYRKTHSELDRIAYIQCRRNVVNVITDAKCQYYNEKLSGSNAKEMFKTIMNFSV